MADPHLILCNGAALTSREGRWRNAPQVRLNLGDGPADVHLHLHHLTRKLFVGVSGVFTDLLEIAALVYSADQAVSRGGTREFEYGRRWRRHFRFEVPVRCLEVWSRPEVVAALRSRLGFLSDDDYEFGFTRLENPPPPDRYLFDETGRDAHDFEEVVLFSGGLDSLAGAVQEILVGQRKVVLVSHRPANQVYHRQCELVRQLEERLVDRRLRPLHVAVEVNVGAANSRDYRHRARSFLFAAIAAVTARLLGLRRIRFFENGVLSLNLPISGQIVGARATRTTHPQVMNGFGRLFGLLFDGSFAVENPFLWKTKAEIIREVRAAGAGELCAATVSCVHTLEQTPEHTHCGRCSQCLDRCLAVLAAGAGETEDPRGRYAADVLTTPRAGVDLALLESYLGAARRVDEIADAATFLRAFPEAARVLRHVAVPPAEAAKLVFDLHRRHAAGVLRALEGEVQRGLGELVRFRYPANCLLSLACGRRAPRPVPHGTEHAPPPPGANGAEKLAVDRDRFEVRFGGAVCVLGYTVEFRLLERLSRTPNAYVSHHDLANEVWGDDQTSANAIHRAASNLRSRLNAAGVAVTIDGEQRGHYRVVVPSEGISVNASAGNQRKLSDP
jgi:7-cyano-7-deazaguanine synthase in queuosine biosynthesis/DNA-binding winged helix-turn-helix (wHTH) protein